MLMSRGKSSTPDPRTGSGTGQRDSSAMTDLSDDTWRRIAGTRLRSVIVRAVDGHLADVSMGRDEDR